MVDCLAIGLQKYFAIIHVDSTNFLVDCYSRGIEFSTDDFVGVELHDPGLSVGCYDDDHVVGGGYVDGFGEVGDLVECGLVVADE